MKNSLLVIALLSACGSLPVDTEKPPVGTSQKTTEATNKETEIQAPQVLGVEDVTLVAGEKLVVIGRYFLDEAPTETNASLGNTNIEIQSLTDERIELLIPANLKAGLYDVTITKKTIRSNSKSITVAVNIESYLNASDTDIPTIYDGNTMKLIGSGFGAFQGDSTVRCGTSTGNLPISITPATWSDTEITFVMTGPSAPIPGCQYSDIFVGIQVGGTFDTIGFRHL